MIKLSVLIRNLRMIVHLEIYLFVTSVKEVHLSYVKGVYR